MFTLSIFLISFFFFSLHVGRPGRIVYLTTQFIAVTAMVIVGAICKNITKNLTLIPFFRYWFGSMISLIVFATAFAQIFHVYPAEDRRLCSRPVRFWIRTICASAILCFTFIPETSLAEPWWILLIGCTMVPFTIAEWIGRARMNGGKSRKKHGSVHKGDHSDVLEKKRQSVPLLGHHDQDF